MQIKFEMKGEHGNMIVTGDLDLYSSTFLKESFIKVKPSLPKGLNIDLHEVPYLDSSGIGVLINILSILRTDGKTLTISGLNDQCLNVLRLTNLHTFFTIK